MVGGRRRILIIEDDSETAEQLVDFLSTSGYQVDLAGNGSDGLSRGNSADYAVMVIDRMLPDIDGLAVIRRLREGGVVTPALIISALGEIDDRVRGLRAGGDDYLVKPFAFTELLGPTQCYRRQGNGATRRRSRSGSGGADSEPRWPEHRAAATRISSSRVPGS
jgi:two-component system, OmpR family, response regulator